MADDTLDLGSGTQPNAPAQPSSELGRGEVVGGRWRLEEFLNSGSMGRVWRATDLHLSEPVAIKLMDPALVQTETARQRFIREAQAAAKLRGPHVVSVLDFDVDPVRRVPYLAMELLRGQDLSRRVEQGPLSYAETVSVISGVCVAISRAHQLDIVHRDLKPANVFLVAGPEEPVAKVLDFGIVKIGVEIVSHDGRPLTLAGTTLGTVSYMSPEQIEDAKQVDHRADLWSVGVITYECMTGRRPFRGESLVELIREICFGEPTPPSMIAEVPRGFDEWFARATHREPDRRFATAAELLASLRELGSSRRGGSPRPLGSTSRDSGRASARARAPGPSARTDEPPPAPLQSWASDANQIDIRLLEDVTFKNAVVHEFLESTNKHFVSGSKGLGKTLLLTYKRSLLDEHYRSADRPQSGTSVKFVPAGRPYLDLMGDLPTMGQTKIELMSSLIRCKRLWGFAFRVSALSHHEGLVDPQQDAEDLARFPRRLRAMLEGRHSEPTLVVKELLSLPYRQINQVIDGSESFLEHKLRSLHSAMFIFVDKLDQALRQLPRPAWVHMQAGMLEAAWDLMNTNRHVKIFATIREEAFSGYESDIKTNLYGATSTLRYSKGDLLDLLEKLTFFYERLPLRDFVILDVVSGARAARDESAFDYIYRHTLGRPRDLVIIASEISRNRRTLDEDTLTRIVRETSAGVLVSSLFDEMRVFLEVLADRQQRDRLLASLPYNILTHEEIVELWCAFHGVDREYYELHGKESDDVYHPFRELYDCGLLGIVERDPGSGRRRQRFRRPYDAIAGSRRQLPRSRTYLLHPALQALVSSLAAGGSFRVFRHVLVGHGLAWPRHLQRLIEVQRELFVLGDEVDEDTEEAVFSLLARVDAHVSRGEPFDVARELVATSGALPRVTARLERYGWDDLHLALLELFPSTGPLLERGSPPARRSAGALEASSSASGQTGRAEVAMLLVDIVKSTRMVIDLGDTHFVEQVETLRQAFASAHRLLAPRLLKGTGDGYLGVYDTVDHALTIARALREELAGAIRLRLVIHCGRVRVGDEDVYGSEVHRLFRLESTSEAARVGQTGDGPTLPAADRVVLSRAALRELPAATREEFRRVGEFRLEGFDQPEELWVEEGS